MERCHDCHWWSPWDDLTEDGDVPQRGTCDRFEHRIAPGGPGGAMLSIGSSFSTGRDFGCIQWRMAYDPAPERPTDLGEE